MEVEESRFKTDKHVHLDFWRLQTASEQDIPNQACMYCGEEFFMAGVPRPTDVVACSSSCCKKAEELIEKYDGR